MAIASGIGGRRKEQGEEARGETAHVLHGAKVFDVWISRTARGTWNPVRLDSRDSGEEQESYLVSENTNVIKGK